MNNKIKYSMLAMATLAAVALAVALLSVNPARAATAYYVDCSAGSNGDGSQSSPWNNLTTVNGTTFSAGDMILFKRGSVCVGTLSPQGSGASGSPIIIDAYGTGNKPLIAGSGAANAVYLYNQQYWEIRNLEVTNTGATSANRRGVYIKLENFGTGTYYRITGLTIHDVNGDNTKDAGGSSGLHFDVVGSTTPSKFSDVVVDGNTIYTVDRSGINMSSQWWCRASVNCSSGLAFYPWDPMIIRNNLVYDIGGDGIVAQYASGSLVENNVLHDANVRSGLCNAGIWGWNADNLVFQHNEAYLVRLNTGTCDGQGFDIDYGQTGTIMQYNYSHDNDGGFMLICTGWTNSNVNGIVRYNISQNDKTWVFHVSGPVQNTLVYNNTIYLPTGSTAGVVVSGKWNADPKSIAFYNNIFYNLGSGGYTVTRYFTFDYNLYYGNHPSTEPSDSHKFTANPLLVNPGSGGNGLTTVAGYKLQPGSPAIGVGKVITNNGGFDFWGNPVSASSAPSIGAHEFSGDTEPTPTTGPSPTPTNTPTTGPTPTPTNTLIPSVTPTPTKTVTPGGPTVMHVFDMYTTDASGNPQSTFTAGTTIYYRVKIVDQSGVAVSGASVTCTIVRSDGNTWTTQTVTTGADGWALFSKSSSKQQMKTLYTITVTNVVKTGATYDASANVKSSTTFTIQ